MEDFDGLQAMLIRRSRSLIVAPPMLGSLQDEGPGAVGGAYATYLKKYMFASSTCSVDEVHTSITSRTIINHQ